LKSRVFYVKADQSRKAKQPKTSMNDTLDMHVPGEELEKCYFNPEEELIEKYATMTWVSEPKIIDCTNPNSMDRNVVKEEFILSAIPWKVFPTICTSLQNTILGAK